MCVFDTNFLFQLSFVVLWLKLHTVAQITIEYLRGAHKVVDQYQRLNNEICLRFSLMEDRRFCEQQKSP